MPTVILHHKGAYQLYTTVADGPCYEHALTLDELKDIVRFEHGEAGVRELPARLARAHAKGTSSIVYDTLTDQLRCNRAGPNETEMGEGDFIAKYLTLPPNNQAHLRERA